MEDESIVMPFLLWGAATLAMFGIAPGIALYAKGRWRQNLTAEARRRIVWSYAGCVASVVLGGVWTAWRMRQLLETHPVWEPLPNFYFMTALWQAPLPLGCLCAHYSLLAMRGGSSMLQNMAKGAKGIFWFNCVVVLYCVCKGVAWEFTE